MISLLPALAIALIAAVVLIVTLPTWATVCLCLAGILILISSDAGYTRWRRGGPA